MPKVSPAQTSFNGGEFSPLLYGRVDNDRYNTGLKRCLNYIPTIQGGLTRRPGTYYVNEVKDSDDSTRLISFQFSITQAYIIEAGDLYFRFYKDNGVIESSPGTPYEIVSGYDKADLFQLKFTQSADVLYITHPDYPPSKLSRVSDTNWTLEEIEFFNGPYLPNNDRGFTITPGAATGNGVTITSGPTNSVTGTSNAAGLVRLTIGAHLYKVGDKVHVSSVLGTTEANGNWTIASVGATRIDLAGSTYANAWISGGTVYPGVFTPSTDIGRLIRMQEGAAWGWGVIATVTNYAVATIDIEATLTNTNAKKIWRLGVWSDTTGYPAAVVFHEDRLCFTGAPNTPQRIDGSRTSDYENFSPSDADGTITASHAINFTLNANDVNVARWLTSDEKGLLAGTVGGEWVMRASSLSEAISPTNVTAKKSTSYGSANIQPVQVGKATLFIQRSTRKLREFVYFYDVDGFRSPDLTILAEHITGEGVIEVAYQREPQSLIWLVREDGSLIAVTYERDLDSLRAGWHEHVVGGFGDAANNQAKVESIAVIPSPDSTREEVWMVVKRYINGAVFRSVEYMTKLFEDTDDQSEAFFVDCGLTYDDPKTITAITKASVGVITVVGHGFNNGDKLLLNDILGMSELNGITVLVANKTTDTFEITDNSGTNINTTNYTTYVSGGKARKMVSSVSGLTHLEGQTVSVLADGAVQPNKVVTSGAVTITPKAAIIHIGLPYNSDGQMLRLEAGSADGTALGKTRRTHRVGFLLHRSLGLQIGTSFDELDTVTFRRTSDPMTRAPALFSGIISESIQADYDFENQICWRQSQPLPSTILAIMPQMVTQDRG